MYPTPFHAVSILKQSINLKMYPNWQQMGAAAPAQQMQYNQYQQQMYQWYYQQQNQAQNPAGVVQPPVPTSMPPLPEAAPPPPSEEKPPLPPEPPPQPPAEEEKVTIAVKHVLVVKN